MGNRRAEVVGAPRGVLRSLGEVSAVGLTNGLCFRAAEDVSRFLSDGVVCRNRVLRSSRVVARVDRSKFLFVRVFANWSTRTFCEGELMIDRGQMRAQLLYQ